MKITPAEEGILDVEITDVTGMTVYCFEKRVEPGNPLIITWESGNVRQGVYLVRMKINDEIVIRKIVKN
jgi:hypothetical protein